jgi:hypothetical protein
VFNVLRPRRIRLGVGVFRACLERQLMKWSE